ncbi:MAG: ester cyclase [Candidatus Limnocylindrales bacterium]|jgi:predicted ester cyclase
MGTDDNKAIVLRYWERCWNHQNPSAILETHHETFAQNGVPLGTAAFERSLAGFFQAFPDVHVSIEDVMALDDRVLTRVVYYGTQTGPYEGLQPTGHRIRVTGLELFLLLDGRIIQHWHEMDHLAILRQIGEESEGAEMSPGGDCAFERRSDE